MDRSGKRPFTSVRTQSRRCPGGTLFSILQATTQSWQPMHCRVSITIPRRAMTVSLREFFQRYVIGVDARAPHQGIYLPPGAELRRARAFPVGALPCLRFAAEAVHQVHALGPD